MQPTINLERPRKVTVVQSIIEQIVRQIQTGNLKVGDKLPSERQLIEMLHVSRSSVREALQGLAIMGVIESRAGQGSFVSPKVRLITPDLNDPSLPATLQRDMLLSLIESRRTIEGEVARLAAERATETSVARLRNAFRAYEQFARRQDSDREAPDFHHQFHATLAEVSGNPFFVLVVETLLRAVPWSLRESEFVGDSESDQMGLFDTEVELHRAILSAVARGEGAAAQQAMHEHMDVELRLVHEAFRDQ
jgi:GntR family transcriptional repressor for pyruvate dehydrogenase complex